jgi:hypothetical protein
MRPPLYHILLLDLLQLLAAAELLLLVLNGSPVNSPPNVLFILLKLRYYSS